MQPLTDLAQRVELLISSEALIRRWRDKEYDLTTHSSTRWILPGKMILAIN